MLRVLQFTCDKHEEPGTGVISDWYRKELLAQARAEFDGLLLKLSKQHAKDWSTYDYFPLHGGKHSGIYELRFTADKKEYRPLCFLLPPTEFGGSDLDVLVLLIGAYKKGKTWTPQNARDSAVERKKLALANRSILHEYDYF